MAEAEGIPPTAGTAIVGKSINYIAGGYWAGWSGQVVTNNSTETALEFTSPGAPLKALLNWATDFAQMGSGETYKLQIELNNQIVWRFNTKNEAARASADWDPIHLIIPPFSIFKLTVFCETASDLKWTINLMAKEL